MKPNPSKFILLFLLCLASLALSGCVIIATDGACITFEQKTDLAPLSNIQTATTRSQNGEEGNKEGTADGGGTTDANLQIPLK